MVSFLGTQVKERTAISDEVIASKLMASANATANAYLNAALACSTPELRAMYEETLNQVLNEHAQLSKLTLDQGWVNPYTSPREQLANILDKSKLVLENDNAD